MKNSIKYQLNIMFHKKEFAAAFLVMLAYCVYSYVVAARMQWGTNLSQLYSADAMFCGNAFMYTWGYFSYIFAFVVALPYATSYLSDLEGNLIPLIATRKKKREYYLSKMISCFIGNVVIIFIPFLVNLTLCYLTFPDNRNYMFGEYGRYNYFGNIMGTNIAVKTNYGAIPFIGIFLKSSLLYCLLFILLLSLASGIFGVFLLSISFLWKMHKAILFLPVYLGILISSVVSVRTYSLAADNPNYTYVNYEIMDYFSTFSYYGKNYLYLFGLFLILIVFCIAAYRKVLKSDELITGGRRSGW